MERKEFAPLPVGSLTRQHEKEFEKQEKIVAMALHEYLQQVPYAKEQYVLAEMVDSSVDVFSEMKEGQRFLNREQRASRYLYTRTLVNSEILCNRFDEKLAEAFDIENPDRIWCENIKGRPARRLRSSSIYFNDSGRVLEQMRNDFYSPYEESNPTLLRMKKSL